jgi:formylmethanofuran dehydrogenase subunit C
MKDGTIIVDGNAGLEVGMRMRGGLIVIRGQARDFTGLQMKGGMIVLVAGAEIRTGAWMHKGTIISLKPLQMMPTFNYVGDRAPSELSEHLSRLTEFGVGLPNAADGVFRLFSGDLSVSDKGEILVWQPGA